MSVRRFENREHGHFKFWTIRPPKLTVDEKGIKSWTNLVTYGKINTDGKDHFNTFWSEYAAQSHYDAKIKEKLKKGYKEVTEKKPILMMQPGVLVPKQVKKAPVCQHLQLRKKNDLSWECNACKTLIEFDKPQPGVAASIIDTEEKAHRFFDLSAFKD